MVLLEGKAGVLTPRDDDILTDLYLCRYLTTAQIASLHFPSTNRAKNRMFDLKAKGWVASNVLYPPGRPRLAYWRLTRDGFDVYASELRTGERWSPKQLGPKRVQHHLETNDLYVSAKPSILDPQFGPHPTWEWKHEARAYRSRQRSGTDTAHMPDAEILTPKHLYLIERQTKKNRGGPNIIWEKVSNHKAHLDYGFDEPLDGTVVFVCDDQRDTETARRTGASLRCPVIAGDLPTVLHHLEEHLREAHQSRPNYHPHQNIRTA